MTFENKTKALLLWQYSYLQSLTGSYIDFTSIPMTKIPKLFLPELIKF